MLEIKFDFSSCSCLKRCDELSYLLEINQYRRTWELLKNCFNIKLRIYIFSSKRSYFIYLSTSRDQFLPIDSTPSLLSLRLSGRIWGSDGLACWHFCVFDHWTAYDGFEIISKCWLQVKSKTSNKWWKARKTKKVFGQPSTPFLSY